MILIIRGHIRKSFEKKELYNLVKKLHIMIPDVKIFIHTWNIFSNNISWRKININNKSVNEKIIYDYFGDLKHLIKHKKLKTLDYLFNGDDYQILFTASKSKRKYIKNLSSKMNQKISIIGQINTKSKNYLLDNRIIPIKYIKYQGYSHIF